MSRHSDDRLVAYLDGEIEARIEREIEAWLDSDPSARDRLAALAESAELVRQAYDEILREPLPDRLIAAARGRDCSVTGRPRFAVSARADGAAAGSPAAAVGRRCRSRPRYSVSWSAAGPPISVRGKISSDRNATNTAPAAGGGGGQQPLARQRRR